VLGIRRLGGGQQYEIQWRGQQETTWEAASRVRKEVPRLVQEFEQRQTEQLQQLPPAKEGSTDSDSSMQLEVAVQPGSGAAPGNVALQQQVAELALLVKQQAQRAEEQQQRAQQQEQLIEQLRASPAHSPHPSAPASPQRLQQRSAGASAAAAQPRRKEPRLSDLAEYNGASGDKLDAWLAELRRCARYYNLSGVEAVEFAAARLRDSADLWWTTLNSKTQAAINSVDALATALRGRFQPVTTARKAREQLHSLRQGSRHIDEYIAEFGKLHAQVPDMAEPDARAQFVRGLQQDLANKLEELDWESMPLHTLVARAARIGARTAAAGRMQQGKPSLNQMDVDDDTGALPSKEMWQALLNAMAARDTSGMGSKTQTHHGYTQQRDSQRGGRGGAHGGGRGGFRRGPPEVPGVPEQVVRQRMDAQQCIRCGQDGHRSTGCPNAISARGN
jgi:hypothetical protein